MADWNDWECKDWAREDREAQHSEDRDYKPWQQNSWDPTFEPADPHAYQRPITTEYLESVATDDLAALSNPVASQASTSVPPCKFYGTRQGCRKGNECCFAHHVDALPHLTEFIAQFTVSSRPVVPASPGIRVQQVCRFFGTPGGCDRGPSCRFAHCQPQ